MDTQQSPQSSSSSSHQSSPLKTIQKQILGQQIKCTLNDNRTITGELICMDRLQNMILIHAREERKVHESVYYSNDDNKDDRMRKEDTHKKDEEEDGSESGWIVFQRDITQVLVPGDKLIKVEINSGLLL